jgi:hypothetical protein
MNVPCLKTCSFCVADSLASYSALMVDERSPFKDITKISANGASGSTGKGGWYARLSDEKKAEYLNKL